MMEEAHQGSERQVGRAAGDGRGERADDKARREIGSRKDGWMMGWVWTAGGGEARRAGLRGRGRGQQTGQEERDGPER
jgi:hypothetical protein